jgi:hypothetical protein
MTKGRRLLNFRSLDEIMPEVDRLQKGSTKVGNWSLGQMCLHLATVMRRVVDLPEPTSFDSSKWVGEEQKREFFESGVVPEGIPTSVPPPDAGTLDDREAAEELRRAIAHYQTSPGPVAPHPRLGFLTRDQWDRFHCYHAAHHLSFVIPSSEPR